MPVHRGDGCFVLVGPLWGGGRKALRRAMLLSDFDLTILVTRPISAGLILFAILSLGYPLIQKYILKGKGKEGLG